MPMRSFTLPSGLKNSHLSRMVAGAPSVTLFKRTSGVWPTVSTMLLYMRPIKPQFVLVYVTAKSVRGAMFTRMPSASKGKIR